MAGATYAYALYVLARNGAAPVGDLRYYADTKIDAFATPIAKAQIAAAAACSATVRAQSGVYAAAAASLSAAPPRTKAAPTMARRGAMLRRS